MGAAVVFHLLIGAWWQTRHIGKIGSVATIGWRSTELASASAFDEDVELQTACRGDAILATVARGAMCLAPWVGDGQAPACFDDLETYFYMDLSGCDRPPSSTPVAMLEPKHQRELDALEVIDPERLLEELQQQPKPEQQPPPPPPQPQQAQPPPPPPPPPAPTRPSQVVETVKPNTEQEPPDARFLSENNVKVEKQKVARGATKEPMVAKSKPEELVAKKDPPKEDPATKEKPPELPPGEKKDAPDKPGKLSMRKPGAVSPQETPQEAHVKGADGGSKNPVMRDGWVPRKGDSAVAQERRDPGELTKGQGGAGGGAPPVPNLKPNQEQLERALGGGSVDHLEDVDSGDETALSSKRWVYASFFNRLKRQVAQNWDPQTVWHRSDPQGSKHGFKTRITEVRVTLGAKGDLQRITVTTPSGVSELDDEAVRAFHAAAPFPNPPDGLANKDKLITFAFSFYFEIGQPHTSWRVIRN